MTGFTSTFVKIPRLEFQNMYLLLFQKSFGFTLWQQISENVLSKLYPSATDAIKTAAKQHVFTSLVNNGNPIGDTVAATVTLEDDDDSNDRMPETTTKRNRHVTLTRGLSKYGPWGYLILGMLLCGGALLLCVLWGMYLHEMSWLIGYYNFINYLALLHLYTNKWLHLHVTFTHSFSSFLSLLLKFFFFY